MLKYFEKLSGAGLALRALAIVAVAAVAVWLFLPELGEPDLTGATGVDGDQLAPAIAQVTVGASADAARPPTAGSAGILPDAAPRDPEWYAQVLAQAEAHRGNPSDEMAWDGTAGIESRDAGTL